MEITGISITPNIVLKIWHGKYSVTLNILCRLYY